MKKLLALAAVVAVAGWIGTSSAMDRSGSFGIGYQESFTSGGGYAGNTLGSWSIKYGMTSNITLQAAFGLDMINKGGDNKANFGARLLYDLVENEMSDFYVGLGFGYMMDGANALGADAKALRIQIPLGFEWAFSGLPELGFSAEVGFVWDYMTDRKQSQIYTAGGNFGGQLGLGVHYYF